MAITVSGSTITFNDGTTQSTAFTGSSIPAINAVGTIQAMLVTYGTDSSALRLGDTVSGSYVFYASAGYNQGSNFGFVENSGQSFTLYNRTTSFTFTGTGGSTWVPTSGTWRVIGGGVNYGSRNEGCAQTARLILLQRIA